MLMPCGANISRLRWHAIGCLNTQYLRTIRGTQQTGAPVSHGAVSLSHGESVLCGVYACISIKHPINREIASRCAWIAYWSDIKGLPTSSFLLAIVDEVVENFIQQEFSNISPAVGPDRMTASIKLYTNHGCPCSYPAL